jgi:hypothetical protein
LRVEPSAAPFRPKHGKHLIFKMKNLEHTILISTSEGISKEATKASQLSSLFDKLYKPAIVIGAALGVGGGIGTSITRAIAQHSVLKKLKQSYPENQHKLLAEVYGTLLHTAPHMASNYLIAKTIIDQKMDHIEQMHGSHPKGIQLPLTSVEQAISMEKGTPMAPARSTGNPLINLGDALVDKAKLLSEQHMKEDAHNQKYASDPIEDNSFETFLEGLL